MFVADSKKIKKFLGSNLPKTKEIKKEKSENKGENKREKPKMVKIADKKIIFSKSMSLVFKKQKMTDPTTYFMNNWDFGKFRKKNGKAFKSINFSLGSKFD